MGQKFPMENDLSSGHNPSQKHTFEMISLSLLSYVEAITLAGKMAPMTEAWRDRVAQTAA